MVSFLCNRTCTYIFCNPAVKIFPALRWFKSKKYLNKIDKSHTQKNNTFMYVSTESKLHFLLIKHFLNCSFQILIVILIAILNYKFSLLKKVACTGDWTLISRVSRFMPFTNRGHFFTNWRHTKSVSKNCHNSWTVQNSLMKLQSLAQLIKMCVTSKNENFCSFSVLVIYPCSDNSKTNLQRRIQRGFVELARTPL